MGHKDNFLFIKYCLLYVLLEEIEYCTVSVYTSLKIKLLDEEKWSVERAYLCESWDAFSGRS